MTAPVLLSVQDAVATITLNRPHRRNAISWDLVTALVDALEQVRDDPALRAVVLTGAGGDFSVGADLARVGSDEQHDQDTRTLRGRSRDDDLERLTFASRATGLLLSSPIPTIAAIDGACAGAGLSLALATDLHVASERAVFNTAFLAAAVPGDFGSAWLLNRAVGPSRARAMLLDPKKLDAPTAAGLGLVTEVVPDVAARTHDLARGLAERAPLAVRGVMQNVNDAAALPFAEYVQHEVVRMTDCARSQDARRAARAFIDKQTPTFTGE